MALSFWGVSELARIRLYVVQCGFCFQPGTEVPVQAQVREPKMYMQVQLRPPLWCGAAAEPFPGNCWQMQYGRVH